MKKQHRDHFVEFKEHTLLKHAILRRYLSAWAFKLTGWRAQRKKPHFSQIWFVDAFAGRGADAAGNPGSPLIACGVARELRNAIGDVCPMRVIAIEKERENYEALKLNAADFIHQRTLFAREGTLADDDRLEKLVAHVRGAPVLFFLDPFGVDGLRRDLLPRMLAGAHNEVFALFSDAGAARLAAVLARSERDSEAELTRLLESPSLFAEDDKAAAEARRTEIEISNNALAATKAGAERILGDAIGEDATRVVAAESTQARMEQAVEIWVEALREAGAKYTAVLPVRIQDGGRPHVLVYATKSKAGLLAMKEAMSASLKDTALSENIVEQIVLERSPNVEALLDDLASSHAGEEVAWTNVGGLKEEILLQTSVLQGQLPAVKAALESRGWVTSKKPYRVSFP